MDGRYCFVVQNWRIPPQNDNLLEELLSGTEKPFFPCQLTTWLSTQFPAFAQTRGWFVCSSHPWFHCALWSAFGLPQLPSFSHSATRCLPYLSPNAGALSLWHSLPQWAYGRVRVPRNLDCTRPGDRSLLSWSKKVWTQPKFSMWMIRETLRDDNQIRIRDKQTKILMSERVCCDDPWMLVHWICLCFSLFLFTQTLTLLVIASSFKIEEFLHNMAISLKHCPVEQNNHSFLARWHDWPLRYDHSLRLVDIWSVHLCIPVSLPQSKTRLQKAFSPNAGALSLWHSLPLRGVW